jgi:glycosyltransferase involved in cell wall biosynthesis
MVLKNAINKARHIIAVSEFTKRDIMRHLSVDEQKISVTQLGIDKMLLGTNVLRNTPQFDQYLFDKFKIHKQYVVYVGSAYPHKNLEKLVNAFALTRLKYKRNWQLVLVGRIDEFYKRLQTYVNENVKGDNIKKDIIFTGQISDKELDGVYRGAKLLAYPSLYEGFGLPALEAASRGIPVVCASSSSLPEVMADAAYYFNPKDINHMASVLDLVGGSHKIQDEIAKKGLARSQQFSWQRTAQETLAVYNSLR